MILENINYLQEVVNPLYAFPVVGVVLCALLVFAFGFKTPAQPPSFDFVEQRKYTTKKKTKSKDVKQTKPVQNGSAHASDSASNSSNVPAKTQNAKPVKNDAPVTKKAVPVENKTKTKKPETSNLEKKNAKPETAEEAPDNSGFGEWTQQLSRKERKNKKGKEVGVSLKNTINLLTPSQKLISPNESTSTKEEKSTLEKKENIADEKNAKEKKNIENKENIEDNKIIEDKENIDDKEKSPATNEVPTKDATQDELSSKKSKKKKKDAAQVPVSVQSTEDKEKAPEIKSTKEGSKKAKKAAKAGSKSQNADSVDKELAGEMQLEIPPTKEAESEVPVTESLPKTTENVSAIESPNDENSAKPASNVVFDELGDLWQDAKPQKKKKKVRRE